MKLSICIPTYKRPQILADTLSHLASHPELELEVVVSDNCSQDSTPDVVRAHHSQFGALRYHCQSENRGVFQNVQTAMSLASGRYSYLLSDDDRLVPAGMQVAVAWLDRDPELVAVFGSYHEWEPQADQILSTTTFVNEPVVYGPADKLAIFTRFPLLWLPVVRTEVYQRYCFYDDDTWGFWRIIETLMTHGRVVVIPDIFYKHAHTEPRMEYNLTEFWFHDKHRSDFELFYGRLEPDLSRPQSVQDFVQFVSARSVPTYMQGYRFACIKREFLKQRHFLLRSRAYGLVTSEQLLAWEQATLAHAAAERLTKILGNFPAVRRLVVEDTAVMRSFLAILARACPALPEALYLGSDAIIARDQDDSEFLLCEQYATLASRVQAYAHINRGLQYALYDLIASLRLTNGPLNITFAAA